MSKVKLGFPGTNFAFTGFVKLIICSSVIRCAARASKNRVTAACDQENLMDDFGFFPFETYATTEMSGCDFSSGGGAESVNLSSPSSNDNPPLAASRS